MPDSIATYSKYVFVASLLKYGRARESSDEEVLAHQHARAWMAIGAASRLYPLRALHHDDAALPSWKDSISRAYWSVYILERLFAPHAPDFSFADAPAYPESAPLPPPPISTPTAGQSTRPEWGTPLTSDVPSSKDIGISGYFIRIISIWGHTRSYLHRLRGGEVEKPWSPESTYTKLSVELIEFEAQLTKEHLLLNLGFPDRTRAETSQHLEYWNAWITTQLLWHAAQAVLHHPFVHLVVLRPREGFSESCLFLQQKVDMAMYHAGWLFRILQLSEDRLGIVDPLIGDAVAAAATVPWLFQFAKDPQVAKRARDALDICEVFLGRIAATWPHISQKVRTTSCIPPGFT